MGKELKHLLVACNHLDQIGGSEAYTFDLLKALKEIDGLEIEYFTFSPGLISQKIEEELEISFMQRSKYDLILASHNTCVNELHNRGNIIQICHGKIPSLEQPSPLADYHVAISQEVSIHLTDLGYPNSIVLNGIDIEMKQTLNDPSEKVESVLSLCQSEKANQLIRKICFMRGWKFRAFNKHKNPTLDIISKINKSDIVVGIGRSIYDAMACGRPCLIYDHRGYNGNLADGYLTPSNFSKYILFNCSGRYLKRQYTQQELLREFDKYDVSHGKELRKIAIEELNSSKMANDLLALTQQITLSNKIKKWFRYTSHKKLIKHEFLYKPIYQLTGLPYFNKSRKDYYS